MAEKLTAFLELEAAICKIVLTLSVAVCQSRARAKSVGRLNRKELHLTLFPHGKTANVQGSLAQPTDESNSSANFVLEEFWETSGPQISDNNAERKQNHENNNEFYLSCVRAIRARMLCAFAASVWHGRADVFSQQLLRL